MEITHIRNRKDQWIFENLTKMEHDEIETFVSKLKDQFGVELKEFSGSVVEWTPIPE